MLNEKTTSAIIAAILESAKEKTAFICGNDGVAEKIKRIISKQHSFKNKILVTGFDRYESTENANYDFPTAYRSRRLLGETAAKVMINLLRSKQNAADARKNIILDPEIRFSTLRTPNTETTP
jgi:DNA-binding LacI/PurR family transcriptional regulator